MSTWRVTRCANWHSHVHDDVADDVAYHEAENFSIDFGTLYLWNGFRGAKDGLVVAYAKGSWESVELIKPAPPNPPPPRPQPPEAPPNAYVKKGG